MRVGIVGAGIGGLAAAAAFTRAGADVVAFDRPGAAPAGAGISLFSNGLRALDAAGVGEAVRALGAPPELPAGIRTPRGDWLTRTPPSSTADLRVVHRGDLHAILAAAAPAVRIETVAEIRTTADGAAVVLESGQRHDFDIVVGADGIGSRVRSTLFDDPGIRYAGYTAWRGVTSEPVQVAEVGETWGRGERFGVAPMADGRVYWFAVASAPPGWPVPDESVEVTKRFASWHPPIVELLRATDPRTILRNDILDLAHPLATFVKDRVVLIGDAAHAMTPNLGQGGNQALEDAVTPGRTRRRRGRPGRRASAVRLDSPRQDGADCPAVPARGPDRPGGQPGRRHAPERFDPGDAGPQRRPRSREDARLAAARAGQRPEMTGTGPSTRSR